MIAIVNVFQSPLAAKTIALDAAAYELLAKAKRPGETFSHVVKREFGPRRPLSDFAGAWQSTLSEREIAGIRAGRGADRQRAARLSPRAR